MHAGVASLWGLSMASSATMLLCALKLLQVPIIPTRMLRSWSADEASAGHKPPAEQEDGAEMVRTVVEAKMSNAC